MKQKNARNFSITAVLLTAFLLWTLAVIKIDVQPVGQKGTTVGLASMNQAFHELTGVHMWIYNITDWLSIIPLLLCIGFCVLGLVQLIKRKSLFKVDSDIIILGIFFVLVIAGYLFFEKVPVNYRPILIEGCLEASYPSSTTLLILSVMPVTAMQCHTRIKNANLAKLVNIVIILFSLFMVGGRLISGVHWLSDIIGGVLLSSGLVMLYYSSVTLVAKRK